MRTGFIVICISLTFLAGTSPGQDAKPKEPATVNDDLTALAGKDRTTWERTKKGAGGETIQLRFSRDKAAKAEVGRVIVSGRDRVENAGFLFKVEEKDKQRFLVATHGSAFEGAGAIPRLPYVLKGEILQIDGGQVSLVEFGIVELKGEWKRVQK